MLKPGAAPLRSYAGEIAAVAEYGLRRTLVDWPGRVDPGCDLFFPWESITAVLVATDLNGLIALSDNAARWQERSGGGNA
jgi:hypothetical protein